MTREITVVSFDPKSYAHVRLQEGRLLLDAEGNERMGLDSDSFQHLIQFDGAGAPVLSVYLTVDPTQRSKYQSRLHLKDLIQNNGAQSVSKDVADVEAFLQNQYEWQDKGLAIFSCAAKKFWQVVRLPVPIADTVSVGHQPYVRPLLGVLSSQGRFGVALVDRENARFFGIYLGEIEELGTARRFAPKHHRQTEASPKVQRHAEEVSLQNLKQAAEQGIPLLQKFQTSQIILAGQEEAVALFKEHLPKAWQARVVGEIALDTEATPTQVLAKAHEVIERVDQQIQEALVEAVADDAQKKGATGTLGLGDTLEALMEAKVMTLIVAVDYHAQGYECENCGYLSAEKIEPCPACGHHMRLVEHAVDLAVRKALGNDAQVETIRSENALSRLKALGGIGAMLRY